MNRADPGEDTELTPPSNDSTAGSQQQLPTVTTYPRTAIVGSSPMQQNPVYQGNEGTYHAANQSYDCTAVEASGDQGMAFFQDPFGMHQYGNTDYELEYGASPTEQSQLLTQNPFGDYCFHAHSGPASHDTGLQITQESLMTYNNGHESHNPPTTHNALSPDTSYRISR